MTTFRILRRCSFSLLNSNCNTPRSVALVSGRSSSPAVYNLTRASSTRVPVQAADNVPSPSLHRVSLTRLSAAYRLQTASATYSPARSFSAVRNTGGPELPCCPEIDTTELAELVKNGEVQLIDVREPYELEDTGILAPNAINIPLDEVANALQMTTEQFQKQYKSPQPNKNDRNIVFYCMAGVRSLVALESARDLGYTNARHYIRGWIGWEEYLENQNEEFSSR